MKTTNKFLALIILCCIVSLTLTSCYNGAFNGNGNSEASDDAETTIEDFVGKWERRTSEEHHILSVAEDGTGKLIFYGQTTSATENFKYKFTDKGIVVEWGKMSKETYYATLTVDGKYLVLDNGASVYVYKKK